MPYERANIHALTGYVPGEQPEAAEVVKLNTNENPYPPPPAVHDALRGVTADQLRRYPPPGARRFREAAAKMHGLSPDQVIAVNGGDELLRLAVTTFCTPRGGGREGRADESGIEGPGGVGETVPTYSLYDVLADLHDTPVTRVPLDARWAIPEDFAPRLLSAGCQLTIVVNPHAPSGRLETVEKLRCLALALRGRAVLLIDEAYVDFADADATALLKADGPGGGLDNVLLLRTLSKGYSLAGLRFGYGLGHRDLIAALDKSRDSYNTDIVAQTLAVAALEQRELARASWLKVMEERGRLAEALDARGFGVLPSWTNFLLAVPPEPHAPFATAQTTAPSPAPPSNAGPHETPPTAAALHRALGERGIFVRYFDQPRLHDKLRITVGTPRHNDALLHALDDLYKRRG